MSTRLSSITNTFFVNLLNRLGVRPPPSDGFDLINTVQPVTLVDSDIVLPVTQSTILMDLSFTTGVQAAPAINTVLADVGAQVAGTYNILVMASAMDAAAVANPQIALQRRDGANAANVWEQRFLFSATAGGPTNLQIIQQFRVQLQTNERIRIINTVAGGAASSYHANIWITV